VAGAKAPPQIAQSQALYREVNERINEIAGDLGLAERFLIVCECASSVCHERIEVTRAEYEHLRRMPRRFAVLRRHGGPGDRIVQENDRFVTVEKIDEAGVTSTGDVDAERADIADRRLGTPGEIPSANESQTRTTP
jgi:hypothetical protein